MDTLFPRIVNKIINSLDEMSFLPTSTDIENDDIKELTGKLKGNSEKETLANILEWESQNIKFWWERWPFSEIILFIIFLPFIIIPFLFVPPISPLIYSKYLVSLAFLLLFFVIALLLRFSNKVKVFYPFLSLPILYLIINSKIDAPILTENIYPTLWNIYATFYVGCLVAIASIATVYFPFRYNKLLGEKKRIYKLNEVVNDTFRSSLPVGKILDYKLAVCRDYTKLTASILFNIYPDSELYFIKIPSHVAVGIKINNQIYVMDQRLPILIKDNWISIRNKKTTIFYAKLIIDSKKIDVNIIECEPISKNSMSKRRSPEINTDKLAEEVSKMLDINQNSLEDEIGFKIKLSDYAKYYDDDEIIEYSFTRAIKNKIKNEFCGNIDKISKISINQSENKKDLTLTVYL